jgi:hypothetical protein
MHLYAKGDRVLQPQYGAGTVTDVNERHTIIDFDEHGVRMFSTPIVTLERTATPAPERTGPRRRTKASGQAAVRGRVPRS